MTPKNGTKRGRAQSITSKNKSPDENEIEIKVDAVSAEQVVEKKNDKLVDKIVEKIIEKGESDKVIDGITGKKEINKNILPSISTAASFFLPVIDTASTSTSISSSVPASSSTSIPSSQPLSTPQPTPTPTPTPTPVQTPVPIPIILPVQAPPINLLSPVRTSTRSTRGASLSVLEEDTQVVQPLVSVGKNKGKFVCLYVTFCYVLCINRYFLYFFHSLFFLQLLFNSHFYSLFLFF